MSSAIRRRRAGSGGGGGGSGTVGAANIWWGQSASEPLIDFRMLARASTSQPWIEKSRFTETLGKAKATVAKFVEDSAFPGGACLGLQAVDPDVSRWIRGVPRPQGPGRQTNAATGRGVNEMGPDWFICKPLQYKRPTSTMRAYLRGVDGVETELEQDEDGTISGLPEGEATIVLRDGEAAEEVVQVDADGTLSGSEIGLGAFTMFRGAMSPTVSLPGRSLQLRTAAKALLDQLAP